MLMNEYQESAKKTAVFDKEHALVYLTLGLAGEAAEVANKIKKPLRQHGVVELSDDSKKELAKELGDVLWYLSLLAGELGYSLDEVAQMNINKLMSRQERGVIEGDGDNR